jgi:hypothetical protein
MWSRVVPNIGFQCRKQNKNDEEDKMAFSPTINKFQIGKWYNLKIDIIEKITFF